MAFVERKQAKRDYLLAFEGDKCLHVAGVPIESLLLGTFITAIGALGVLLLLILLSAAFANPGMFTGVLAGIFLLFAISWFLQARPIPFEIRRKDANDG